MSNSLGPIRISAAVTVLFLFASLGYAQSMDWHFGAEGSKNFFTHSAFAHGYMHGYEEGFHKGDLDLQMARTYKDVKEHEKYRKICGYRPEYGDRSTFERGYRKGYAVGYVDSYSGRSFRAMQLVSEARTATSVSAPNGSVANFDRAFMLGYDAGQTQGLEDGRANANAAALESVQCHDAENCEAYRDGYRLGYSDGFVNQRDHRAIFARK